MKTTTVVVGQTVEGIEYPTKGSLDTRIVVGTVKSLTSRGAPGKWAVVQLEGRTVEGWDWSFQAVGTYAPIVTKLGRNIVS